MSTDKTQSIRNDIAKTEEQIRRLQNRQKILLNKKADAERKARTHRLIERGAILESLIDGAPAMTGEQVKALLMAALATDTARTALRKIREEAKVGETH